MVSRSAQEFETMKSLFCERPRLAIPSFVALRGAARMYPSAGEDRTFVFCVWAEFIASIVPSTRLQLDWSRRLYRGCVQRYYSLISTSSKTMRAAGPATSLMSRNLAL